MKSKHLFWGIFLAVFGILILIRNYVNEEIYFGSLIRFWPVLLIIIGFKILFKNRFFDYVTIILASIFSAFIFYTLIFENITCNFFQNEKDREKHETISTNYNPSIKKGKLDIDFKFGTMRLTTDTKKLIHGEIRFSRGNYFFDGEMKDSIVTYQLKSSEQEPTITFSNKIFNKLNLTLHPKPEWDLKLNTKFSDNKINLSSIDLSSLKLESNFSNTEIIISSFSKSTDINCELNFSNLIIQVPDTVGVDLFLKKNFSTTKLENLEKIDDNHYRTKNFSSKNTSIKINVNANFSNLEIEN